MVKRIAPAWIALAIVSCGGARFVSDRASGFDRPGLEDISPLDDRELTTDDFDRIERLKDNPIDPGEEPLEALLGIPGFPEELGQRIVEATKGTHLGRSWVDRLTPPEKEELYRYREYIVLPRIRPVRFDGRFTEDRLVSGGRKEGRISLSVYGLEALWRGRFSKEANGAAFYVSAKALSGSVRVHAGSFAPDFAMGLIFSGSSPSYLFSNNYPFHRARWIAGTVSSYGPAVHGGTVELWYRRARAVVILGRLREFRSTHFETGKESIVGGRFAVRMADGEIGFSGFGGVTESQRALFSLDGSWHSNALRFGFELGLTGQREPGCLWGFSYGDGRTRAGFLLHSVPGEVAGKFGSVNGRTLGARSHNTGATMVVEREVFSRFHARIAFERYARTSGFEDEDRNVLKVEGEKKWKKVLLRLSWSSAVGRRKKNIPYPAESLAAFKETSSLGLVSTLRISKDRTFKISIRMPHEDDGLGLLFSSALSSSFFSEHLEASVCGMSYRIYEGRPVCYFYEPSLRGTYPWRAVSGNEECCSCLISFHFNRLTFSSKVALESGGPPVASFQACLGF